MKGYIIDYKILSGEDLSSLEGQVRAHVQTKEGWAPSGSLVIKDGHFYQTIKRWQES